MSSCICGDQSPNKGKDQPLISTFIWGLTWHFADIFKPDIPTVVLALSDRTGTVRLTLFHLTLSAPNCLK